MAGERKRGGTSSAYLEQLRDPRWQKRRLEILERDGWSCRYCDAKDKPLHVHHKRYERGKAPWEHSDLYLETLCEDCHAAQSDLDYRIKMALGDIGPSEGLRVLGYLEGLLLSDFPNATVRSEDGEHIQGIADAWGLPVGDVIDAVENHELNGWVLQEIWKKHRAGKP